MAGGKAKTVYSADYFRIVYSDIRFLMIFVYWTIQFIILRYNMDMMIDYTNLLEISAKRIRNTKETFINFEV